MFGLVTAHRYREDLAAARAEVNRQRERAEKAEGIARTEVEARRIIASQNAELDAANIRLTGHVQALGKRALEAQVANGFNPVAAKKTAERIATLQKAAAAGREEAAIARAEARRERRRREQLQKRYDEAVGMPPGGLLDSAVWQPGYQAPKSTPKASTS